ncbi:fibrous sheath-interacting protein 1 isoform X2 [Mastacembelus armatus]|uniref:Fibrous sheath-interacting protein 1 n=1 Tax=Mastacembelus armatus TaxID=205130 RepID=A0A7N9B0W9_9TELE|nr:fibrous sheath-interacting protein 1 isoform X2 [Mastacembelus armatus]
MEIIKGSLDDISRPASSEQTGNVNRVSSVSLPHSDRICPTPPFTLVVLSNDAADIQNPTNTEEAIPLISTSPRGPDRDHSHVDVTDEEKEDSKLQRAIQEMRRLDEILSAEIYKEKEIKRQRRELQANLWKEFQQKKPKGHSECAHEALNTRLFLALEAPTGPEEQGNFVPVFETQVLDCEHDKDSQHLQCEMRPYSSRHSFEAGHEETEEGQFEGSHCDVSKGKKKQDFVKRNIELVCGEEGQVLLTQAERERLAELLREIEEEDDSARGADSEEDMQTLSVLEGHGYTPEACDLQQLIDIDSKMRRLLPVEEFLLVQNSYTDFNISQRAVVYQGHGSDVAWKCYGDLQPGEKVLQDIKERRRQEQRLREIQQQLEILGQSQEMNDETADLTEEQLLSLLDECELTEGWSQDAVTNASTTNTIRP